MKIFCKRTITSNSNNKNPLEILTRSLITISKYMAKIIIILKIIYSIISFNNNKIILIIIIVLIS